MLFRRLVSCLTTLPAPRRRVLTRFARLQTVRPSRLFHQGVYLRRNCDFNTPCDCKECKEDNKKSICQQCKASPATEHIYWSDWDADCGFYYMFESFCAACCPRSDDRDVCRNEALERIYVEREQKLQRDKRQEMMNKVRGITSVREVSIDYAVDKMMEATNPQGARRLPMQQVSRWLFRL